MDLYAELLRGQNRPIPGDCSNSTSSSFTMLLLRTNVIYINMRGIALLFFGSPFAEAWFLFNSWEWKLRICKCDKKSGRKLWFGAYVYSQVFLFFGVGSNSSAISFIQFCRQIIHQFMPENSFDSVQIGVRNQSWNKGGSKSNVTNVSIWSMGFIRAQTLCIPLTHPTEKETNTVRFFPFSNHFSEAVTINKIVDGVHIAALILWHSILILPLFQDSLLTPL